MPKQREVYELLWPGRDSKGNMVKPGQYKAYAIYNLKDQHIQMAVNFKVK